MHLALASGPVSHYNAESISAKAQFRRCPAVRRAEACSTLVPMVTRRELLQTTGLITTGVAFGAAAPMAGNDPGWFDRPMRWAQLNSTEDDAAEMDIPFWMDYF